MLFGAVPMVQRVGHKGHQRGKRVWVVAWGANFHEQHPGLFLESPPPFWLLVESTNYRMHSTVPSSIRGANPRGVLQGGIQAAWCVK